MDVDIFDISLATSVCNGSLWQVEQLARCCYRCVYG